MRTKPILFSTAMVQAILEGRKTQTRRTVKYKKKIQDPKVGFTAFTPEGDFSVRGIHENGEHGESFFKAPIQKGDILWVRETWRLTDFLHPSDENYGYVYKASENGREWEANDEGWKWKPSIFMPKEACRIFLEVTNVRVERLQDISGRDALQEGIKLNIGLKTLNEKVDNAMFNFRNLWQSINGEESWNANPWVWVYDFKKVEKPENF